MSDKIPTDVPMTEDRKQELSQRPFARILPESVNKIKANKCPTCGKEIGEFRNEMSKREYNISGMCQKCQDSVFGVD
jgi:hypothetical protein